MKRFHVHLSVEDLARNIDFYSHLFGAEPTVRKADYAKWMLDDPRVNFAISQRGHSTGVNHLGLQVESDTELAAMRKRFEAADAGATVAELGANCCYAKSDKHWVSDPQGIAWEAFHTLDAIPVFGDDGAQAAQASSCCTPAAAQAAGASERGIPATAQGDTTCCVRPAPGATRACCG